MVVAPGRMLDNFLPFPDAEPLPLYRMVLKLACRSGRMVKAGIPHSSGVGRRGFDPRQLRRTKRAFFPLFAIWNEA